MILLEPRQIIVTKRFVNVANNMTQALNWKNNNGDALLLEYHLITEKIAQKPLNWRHDFIYNGMKIDVKELNSDYFNIQRGKTEQYRESIVNGDLTHFLFYRSTRDKDLRLKPYDVVEIQPIAICSARDIIKAALPSTYDDTEAFVDIESIKVLGEKFEENEESEPRFLWKKSHKIRSISKKSIRVN